MSILKPLAGFIADTRQAIRRLARASAFSTLVVLTLGVGLGINGGMLAVMDALLLRPPMDVDEPENVIGVRFRIQGASSLVERTHYPNFADLRTSAAFEAVAAYVSTTVSVGSGTAASVVDAMLVSREFFAVLRPSPELAALSMADDSVAGLGGQIVISRAFWRRHLGSSSTAIGTQLTVDQKPYIVAGIAPVGFQGLGSRPVDLWLPLDHATTSGMGPRNWRDNRGPFWLNIAARLRRGTNALVAEEQATAALEGRRVELASDRPAAKVVTSSIVPGRGADRPLENRVSLWLAGVSAFVLLIACANVSNLVIARAFAQRREQLILLALGASRSDLVRRILCDALVLVISGAAVAFALSFALRNAIAATLAASIPLSRELFDPRTTAILLGSTSLAFVLLLSVALLQLRKAMSGSELVGTTRVSISSSSVRRFLLATQSALCLCLLFLAGLFAASLNRVESLDLGVDVDHTIQLTLNFGGVASDVTQVRSAYEKTFDFLSAHPRVEGVALAEGSPYMSGSGASPWTPDRSRSELWVKGAEVAYRTAVGQGFFSTVGARSLRGRDFNESDRVGSESVAIVNTALARHLWPDKDGLGQCMWLDDTSTCFRIIGVLDGVWKFSALRRDRMAVYLPLLQFPKTTPGALFIRPRGDVRAFLGEALSTVQAMHPNLPAARGALLRDVVDPEFKPWRLGATVFSAFALVALIIASIGLYGVVTLGTSLRLKEIGIRMSIGASSADVIRVVVGEGFIAVLSGLIVGGGFALVGSRWLGGVLFETSPHDPVILFETAAVLIGVSVFAIALPTARALRTNPAIVLRVD